MNKYDKEKSAYFKYVYDVMFDKIKGKPYWKQIEIINNALMTDPGAPTFTVYTPPGFEGMHDVMMNGFRIRPHYISNLNSGSGDNSRSRTRSKRSKSKSKTSKSRSKTKKGM